MRVTTFYLDALQGGGYPRDIRWLAGALARQGVDISVVARPGRFRDGLDSVAVVDPMHLGSLARVSDVLHVWMLFVPGQFRLWRRLHVPSLVVSPAAHLMDDHLRDKWWKKYPYIVSIAPWLRQQAPVAHLFGEAERPGVDRWLHSSRSFVASLGLFPVTEFPPSVEANDGYLLFLGRNDVYQKGIDILLRGFAAATRNGLSLPLVIAGRSHRDSTKAIGRIVSELHLERSVELLGDVSEARKIELISGARCFVFLSRWDGPPRPIREALALGTPVIVSRETNLGGLVEEFAAGRCVDRKPSAIATALLQCDDDAVTEGWRRGTISLASHMTWDEVALQYLNGYRRALGEW